MKKVLRVNHCISGWEMCEIVNFVIKLKVITEYFFVIIA